MEVAEKCNKLDEKKTEIADLKQLEARFCDYQPMALFGNFKGMIDNALQQMNSQVTELQTQCGQRLMNFEKIINHKLNNQQPNEAIPDYVW